MLRLSTLIFFGEDRGALERREESNMGIIANIKGLRQNPKS